jgi:uncharacterized membrane protein YeaQ/YmgE (transglycosylase-associated protein family)
MKGCLEGLGKLFLYVVGAIVGAIVVIWVISNFIKK